MPLCFLLIICTSENKIQTITEQAVLSELSGQDFTYDGSLINIQSFF